jgi:hypothetical protein
MSRKCTGKCGPLRWFTGCDCARKGYFSKDEDNKDIDKKSELDAANGDNNSNYNSSNSSSSCSSDVILHHYLLFMHSMPFHEKLKAFDVLQEEKRIKDAIKESKVRMKFESLLGTNRNITSLGTDKIPTLLHFTGHGQPADANAESVLIIESDSSELRSLTTTSLSMILGPNVASSIKLVFVATCHSEAIGQVFVDAGVKHVIATCGEVDNKRAECFVDIFYRKLFAGESVLRAFRLANIFQKTEVLQLPGENNFILLPRAEECHNEVLFQHPLHSGNIVDVSSRVCQFFLRTQLIDGAIIRSSYIAQIHKHFFERKRIVTVNGDRGNGSSHVALMACRYLYHRPLFTTIVHVHFRRQAPLTAANDSNKAGNNSLSSSSSGAAAGAGTGRATADYTPPETAKRGGSGNTTTSGSTDSADPDADVHYNEVLEIIHKSVCKHYGVPRDNNRRVTVNALIGTLNELATQYPATQASASVENKAKILLFLDDCDAYLSVKETAMPISKSKSDSRLASTLNTGNTDLAGTPPGAGSAIKHNSLSILPFTSPTSMGPHPTRVSFDSAAAFNRTNLLSSNSSTASSQQMTIESMQNMMNSSKPPINSSKAVPIPVGSNPGGRTIERSVSVSATEGNSMMLASTPDSPSSPRGEKSITVNHPFSDNNPLYRIISQIYKECPHVSFILSHSSKVKLVPTSTATNVRFMEYLVNVLPLEPNESGLLLNRL